MKPILFTIFGINIYGYGLMIALGILFGFLLLDKRAKDKGYDSDTIFDVTIFAIIAGVIGGKLLYIITDINTIINNPSMLKDVGSGFVVYGSIIGGALAVYFYSKKNKWNVLKIFDLMIPSVSLAQAFGRIGCLLAGCCYGAPTNSPLSITFTNTLLAPLGVPLHPTQIYSSILDLLLTLFLLWYDKKAPKQGRVFYMYMILYSVGRILIEFIRDDPRGNVGIFSTSQFIGVITVVLGILLFNVDKIKGRLVKSDKK
ncbi:prolipoprotein diacylglyceryl transferase [Clostridium algidicarnis]|uniref:prolipoprotein diacylglyceryl transferase n=1 Tax=Clostridium algidicarnis TaxID=37659 RepID=UPI001C0B314C|nr:prolipoprotein diacylglyceryl transferase [Clostridium algidicarnis]MBU3228375.1 prolipoprotein diacylglyceryl transferase [Clostridium algidicarnis]MBU3251432.1 prolipoprotein diacylglyceryl transferase [Clostridium algidicarnis]